NGTRAAVATQQRPTGQCEHGRQGMALAPTAAKVGHLSEDLDEGLRLCYHTSPPADRVLVHAGRARQAGPHVEQNPLTCFGPVVHLPLRKLNDPAPRRPWAWQSAPCCRVVAAPARRDRAGPAVGAPHTPATPPP